MEQSADSDSSRNGGRASAEDVALDGLLRAVAHAPRARREPEIAEVVGGRYVIESVLGRGGMGVVFAARDRRTNKALALKWMATSSARGSESDRRAALMRFEREAHIAARVAHPNLVDVYDVSIEPDAAYLVMERLEGETLRARIARGRIAWDEALRLLLPAMRGVHALHAAGVIHRDLKPDNIFVCTPREGDRATTKVLDLGISREPDREHEPLTKTGAILGTPAYMPLEQLRGARDIGPTADVYALGVILYEALSGVRPLTARTDADHAVLLATEGTIPLGERVPALAGPRSAAVMRALARDPSQRYPTVSAMMRALEVASAERARMPRALVVCAIAIAAALSIAGVRLAKRATRGAPTVSTSHTNSAPPDGNSERSDANVLGTTVVSGPPPEPLTMAPTARAVRRRSAPRPASMQAETVLDRATSLDRADF